MRSATALGRFLRLFLPTLRLFSDRCNLVQMGHDGPLNVLSFVLNAVGGGGGAVG